MSGFLFLYGGNIKVVVLDTEDAKGIVHDSPHFETWLKMYDPERAIRVITHSPIVHGRIALRTDFHEVVQKDFTEATVEAKLLRSVEHKRECADVLSYDFSGDKVLSTFYLVKAELHFRTIEGFLKEVG